jgi:hypothetical protein
MWDADDKVGEVEHRGSDDASRFRSMPDIKLQNQEIGFIYKYVSLVTRVESIYRTTKERNQHQPKLWYMYTQIPKRLSPRYDANMSNEKCKTLGNQVASQSYAVIIGLESEKDRVQPCINAIPCQSIGFLCKEKRQLLSSRNRNSSLTG